MKHLLILGILLGNLFLGHSQEIIIIDNSTNLPLEFVTIVGITSNNIVHSDQQGVANISSLKGEEKIEIRLLGYENLQHSYIELAKTQSPIKLKVSAFNLDQVVVSANRWKQNKGKVPEKISSISRKDIELQNPQTAADLLEISGEVYIQKSQQGGGSPIIRGFSTNRLLYSVDGIRMNNAIFRGGNIQNVISLDPFAIENTEVLFGPGSIIYGSDAIGGVMSFKTLSPQLSLNDTLKISGNGNTRFSSANDERTAHFDINLGLKKWASVTSFSQFNFGDLKMGSNGPNDYLRPFYVKRSLNYDYVKVNSNEKIQNPTAYNQLNLMQKLLFKANDFWSFEYGFHFSETSDYARYDRHIRLKDGEPWYGEWSYGPQKWIMNSLKISHDKRTFFYDKMTTSLAVQRFEESRISRGFNDNNRETRIEKVDAYSLNQDFRKVISNHEFFYGLEGVLNKVNSIGFDENIRTELITKAASRYPQSSWASYALYLSDVYTYSKKLTFQGGLRYNYFNLDADFDTSFYSLPFTTAKLSNNSVTGSLGLVYRPIDKLVFSVNASTAFRAPNVDDVGKVFDSEPGSVVVPNPDLEAEYAYNLDFGIAKIFHQSIKVDLTAYYTLLENAMVRRDFQLNGKDSIVYDNELSQVQAIQNAAETFVYGIQAGIEVKFPKGFSFSAHANYQYGEEELDNGEISPSRHVAPFFGNARFQFQNKKITLQFYGNYNGEISYKNLNIGEIGKAYLYAADQNGNPYAPEWYTLNLKAFYTLNEFISLSSGIENITDQRYRPYSSGLAGPGRNFILGVNAKF